MRRFTHDCDSCRYQGSGRDHEGKWVDWYWCPGGGLGGSAIGRYGDEGAAYWSMPFSMLKQAAENGIENAGEALRALAK